MRFLVVLAAARAATEDCTRAVFELRLDAAVARQAQEDVLAGWIMVPRDADDAVAGDDALVLARSANWRTATSEVCATDGDFELVVQPADAWACDAFDGVTATSRPGGGPCACRTIELQTMLHKMCSALLLAALVAALDAPRVPARAALRRAVGSCVASASLAAGALGACAATPATVTRFEGEYADQLHPLCERRITVEALDTKPRRYVAHFSGTDVGPRGIGPLVVIACDQANIDKYKLREWAFDGEIKGDEISAGDGVHEGRWNQPKKDSPNPWTGIRWADGNRWILKEEAPKT